MELAKSACTTQLLIFIAGVKIVLRTNWRSFSAGTEEEMNTKKTIAGLLLTSSAFVMSTITSRGQSTPPRQVQPVPQPSATPAGLLYSEQAAQALYKLEDAFLQWPIPPEGRQ